MTSSRAGWPFQPDRSETILRPLHENRLAWAGPGPNQRPTKNFWNG
jgi:hypothetical protein